MIQIFGAKGNIRDIDVFLENIASLSKKYNIIIQAMNADVIFNKEHLISAYEHAIRAMKRKKNSTNSLEMEILLYASGERQIKSSIKKMGVKCGKSNIAFAFVSDNEEISDQMIDNLLKTLDLIRDDKVLDGNINTLKKFGITCKEIKTVTKAKYGHLIMEKVAMVDIIK